MVQLFSLVFENLSGLHLFATPQNSLRFSDAA